MRLWVEHFYLRDNELSRKDWEAMANLDDVRRAIGHGLLLQLVGAMLLIGFLVWLSLRVTGRPRLCIVSRTGAAVFLNERGRPYNPKSIRAMVER